MVYAFGANSADGKPAAATSAGENMDVNLVKLVSGLAQTAPAAILVFLVWYLYHKATVKDYERRSEDQRLRDERQYNILKEQIETLQYHTGILARMEQKIDTNIFCPLTRKEIGKS
jgi:hypothetical protein